MRVDLVKGSEPRVLGGKGISYQMIISSQLTSRAGRILTVGTFSLTKLACPGAEFGKFKRVSSSGRGNPKRRLEISNHERATCGTRLIRLRTLAKHRSRPIQAAALIVCLRLGRFLYAFGLATAEFRHTLTWLVRATR